jgi:CheY-like chemotaxis protein
MDAVAAERARTVLIVEADVLARHELAKYLRGCGYQVIEASTTDEAVTVIDARTPLDALLCDAEAPGSLSAFALSRLARERRPGLDAVLAGNVERAAEAAGVLCDEGPHLARPYDPTLVVDRIRQRIAERERRGRG